MGQKIISQKQELFLSFFAGIEPLVNNFYFIGGNVGSF